MIKKPLVSILITNYNKEKYLKQNLKSCLKQSYKNKEIIFFDDCSEDKSLLLIKKFKKIKLIVNKKKKSNSGPINQLNGLISCYKISKGKIIFLLDSDDFFKKNKLSSIVKDFQKNKELSFIQDTPIFKNFEKAYTSKRKLNLFSIWPRFYPTSTIAVNRKFFKNFIKISQKKKFPNLEIDARISIYAYLKNKFRVSKNKLTIYNNQTNGISSKYNKFSRNWWKKRLEAYKYTFEIMKNLKIKIKKTPDYYLTKFINLII